MFFPADKAYRVPSVPPVVRTVRGAWPLLWLTGAAAFAAVALMWVSMST